MRLQTIEVGRIVNTHGVKGEVRVQPRDADPAFLTRFDTFLLDGKSVSPTSCRIHKSMVLMTLPGVEDMDAAMALRGKRLFIRREDAPECEAFDDELLGLEVFNADTGARLGELVRVDPYPAHKLYTVKGDREYLIPAVPKVFIKTLDLDAGRMEVHLLEGLAVDEI